MFEGTTAGNIIGTLYYLIFIISGIAITSALLKKTRTAIKIWLGTVLGTVMLMWLPVAIAFVFGFNLSTHIAAGIIAFILGLAACIFSKHGTPEFTRADFLALIFIVPMCALYGIVEANHILVPAEDGGMIFGQSTYFDANIHLSFITTPVAQGKIPFNYNILPTMQVSYPFLSDTVSSSVYIWGASLRYAYILPTVIGAFTVFTGAYFFFFEWLKKFSKAIIAWLLFFFNGGFGFIYFLDGLKLSGTNFTRIFTELYQTPTNLNDKMVRWVNTFCDMMIPQRATLFGWMMLFAVLYLLYRAVFNKKKRYFIFAGVLAGLTPLISTHIFLSIGIISVVWMMSRLVPMIRIKPIVISIITLVILGCVLTVAVASYLITKDLDKMALYVLLTGTISIGCSYIFLIILALFKGCFKELCTTWGAYLASVLIFALPQLICFTFKQSGGSGFLVPHFNWVNYQDEYIWFYIKNVGVCALLIIPAVIYADRKNRSVAAPIAILMLIAETFALQPNAYDNNKLLYPAYVLVCGCVASFMLALWEKIKTVKGSRLIAVFTLFLCFISGVLSMGREVVAGEYEIFPAYGVELAEYVEKNTEPDSIFLTGNTYANTITGLTGRNIVCGSNSFFSTHGLPGYDDLQRDIRRIYKNPVKYADLIEKYNVDYILVGPDEIACYQGVNKDTFDECFEIVYQTQDFTLYKV